MGMRIQKRCRELICVALAPIFLAAVTQSAVAAPGDASGYRMDWYVIGAGNSAEAVSESFRLRSTLGQPVVGFSTSAGYALDTGFWFGIGDPACPECIFANGFEQTGEP